LAIRPTLPIIMVSGSSGPRTQAEVREVGIRELISNPLSYAALARALAQVLGP
jgi:CheY-like chemotaxis protein